MTHPEPWLQRWAEGHTGWHQNRPLPLLVQHWPTLAVAPGSRVLVALCGKSLDMLWLSAQGHRVLGVELAGQAIEAFLAENGLRATRRESSTGAAVRVTNPPGAGIEIINDDVFGVDAATLSGCRAFYDRAALIALPKAERARLAGEVYDRMPVGAKGLLVTLEYPQAQMGGPPFSVGEDEVHQLFDPHWQVGRVDFRDILASEPHFAERGLTELGTAVYTLCRTGV